MDNGFTTKVMSIIEDFKANGKYPTYYELEKKAGDKRHIRIDLIYLLRDCYKNNELPKKFFDVLLTKGEYPIEAGFITRENKED